MVQKLKYLLEACAAGFVYFIFKILDVDKASALGGWLGRIVGPYLGVSKIARNNIKNTFPNLSEKNLQKVISKINMAHGIEKGFMPEMEEVLFKSKMIGGGEQTTLELDTSVFTSEIEYIFICSFPGHFALMKGKLKI